MGGQRWDADVGVQTWGQAFAGGQIWGFIWDASEMGIDVGVQILGADVGGQMFGVKKLEDQCWDAYLGGLVLGQLGWMEALGSRSWGADMGGADIGVQMLGC